MSNPDLHRYEKGAPGLGEGFRLRRRLHRSFRQAVMPFLEETAAPSYEELTAAFGPQTRWPRICCERWPTLPSPFAGDKRLGSSWLPA